MAKDPRFNKTRSGWKFYPPLSDIELMIKDLIGDPGMTEGIQLRIDYEWGFERGGCYETWCGRYVVDDGTYRVTHRHLDDAINLIARLHKDETDPKFWRSSLSIETTD